MSPAVLLQLTASPGLLLAGPLGYTTLASNVAPEPGWTHGHTRMRCFVTSPWCHLCPPHLCCPARLCRVTAGPLPAPQQPPDGTTATSVFRSSKISGSPLYERGGKRHRVKSHHELLPGSTWQAPRSSPAALHPYQKAEVRKQVYLHHSGVIAAGNTFLSRSLRPHPQHTLLRTVIRSQRHGRQCGRGTAPQQVTQTLN